MVHTPRSPPLDLVSSPSETKPGVANRTGVLDSCWMELEPQFRSPLLEKSGSSARKQWCPSVPGDVPGMDCPNAGGSQAADVSISHVGFSSFCRSSFPSCGQLGSLGLPPATPEPGGCRCGLVERRRNHSAVLFTLRGWDTVPPPGPPSWDDSPLFPCGRTSARLLSKQGK